MVRKHCERQDRKQTPQHKAPTTMSKANPEPGVLRFPLSRVKRIIKTDTEVKLISTDACVLIAKASVCVCVCVCFGVLPSSCPAFRAP
jgi:Histone-like transcription factor (CBF/NF-Y) and archaeal histone